MLSQHAAAKQGAPGRADGGRRGVAPPPARLAAPSPCVAAVRLRSWEAAAVPPLILLQHHRLAAGNCSEQGWAVPAQH